MEGSCHSVARKSASRKRGFEERVARDLKEKERGRFAHEGLGC